MGRDPVAPLLAGLVVTFTRGAWIAFVVGVLALARRAGWIVVGTVLVLPGGVAGHARGVRRGPPRSGAPPALRQHGGPPRRRECGSASTCGGAGSRCGGSGRCSGSARAASSASTRASRCRRRSRRHTCHVHNTPLQILAERGVLGPRGVALDLGRLLRARDRPCCGGYRPRPGGSARWWWAAWPRSPGFLLGGLSEYNFGDSEVVMVAWALMALPWVVEQAPGFRARAPPSTPRTARSTTAPSRSTA